MTTVALADDHALLRDVLADLIDTLNGFRVIAVASNGLELIERIKVFGPPHVLLPDPDMPEMGGYATGARLRKNHPNTRVLLLSMLASDLIMVQLFKMGVKGFLRKDVSRPELITALNDIMEKGFYFGQRNGKELLDLIQSVGSQISYRGNVVLSLREIELIKLCCTEATRKEIGQKMILAARTVDEMKTVIFNKLGVRGRIGLVVYAMNYGLVHL